MSSKARIALGVLALVGIGVSLYLTLFHFRILNDPTFVSACKFSETFDCDKVNTSSYAKIFGVPLGLYGVAYYLAMLGLVALSFNPGEKFAKALETLFGFSFLSVLLSAVLAYISAVKISAFCLFCISLYVVNLGMLVTSFVGAGGNFGAIIKGLDGELKRIHRSPLFYTAGLVFFGVVVLGGGYYRSEVKAAQDRATDQAISKLVKETRDKAAAERHDMATASSPAPAAATDASPAPKSTASADEVLSTEVFDIPLKGYEPIRGNKNAPMKLVIFSDFECPYCKAAAEQIEVLAKANPDKIAVIYKQYPLDDDCNPYLSRAMHQYACEAAVASLCAQRQGQFWELHDMMFRNQPNLSDTELKGYANSLGIDAAAFAACQNDRTNYLSIAADIEQGKAIPITGTPSIFLNGHRWKGPVNADVMLKVIDALLANP